MNRRLFFQFSLLLSLLLPAYALAQDGEPCDDEITYKAISLTFPDTLTIPTDRSYQLPTEYRYSYIFLESFERADGPLGLAPQSGAAWVSAEAGAIDGDRYLALARPVEGDLATVSSDPANWLVFGPFDLSKGSEGRIMVHLRLGAAEPDRPGSMAILASADGKNFHGLELSGRTCDWFYRKLDLHKVPQIGNLMSQEQLWIALFPTTSPAGNRRPLAIDHLRLLTVNPDLLPEHYTPSLPMRDMPPSYESLLEYYSPYLVQDLAGTEFGDYITRFDFDGNYIGNDNWDHLGQNCGGDCDSHDPSCEPENPLPAYVYGSVIETSTHYFLCYSIFHPADDFKRGELHHENDLEGIIVMVQKNGDTFGSPRLVQLQAHTDYFQYKFPGVTGIHDDNGTLDGTIVVYEDSHPVVHIEGGGHGLRATHEDGPYIHYVYTGTAVDPGFPSPYKVSTHGPYSVDPSQRVGYDLLMIIPEMWFRRTNCGSADDPFMYMEEGDYEGGRAYWGIDDDFVVTDLGKKLAGNTCMTAGGAASAPWNWSDDGDGGCFIYPWIDPPCPTNGDWVLDAAWYHTWQFDWDEPVDETYVYHPYIYNHLCGEVYGMLQPSLSPPYTYRVHGGSVWNPGITVPAGSAGLTLTAGADLLFDEGTALRAQGVFMTHPTMFEPYRLTSSSNPTTGIVIQVGAGLKVQNGGCIRF